MKSSSCFSYHEGSDVSHGTERQTDGFGKRGVIMLPYHTPPHASALQLLA